MKIKNLLLAAVVCLSAATAYSADHSHHTVLEDALQSKKGINNWTIISDKCLSEGKWGDINIHINGTKIEVTGHTNCIKPSDKGHMVQMVEAMQLLNGAVKKYSPEYIQSLLHKIDRGLCEEAKDGYESD